MIRILFIIDSLGIGGTEKQLACLINNLDRKRFQPFLCCLRPPIQLDVRCPKFLLNVFSLKSSHSFKKLIELIHFLRNKKIDVVHTYFFDANVFGIIAAKIAGVRCVISTRRDMGFWYTKKILLVLRVLNSFVDRILVNSASVRKNVMIYEQANKSKIDIIPNFVSLETFNGIDQRLASNKRKELGISDNAIVVGIISNLNRSVKRVDDFLRSASIVIKKHPTVRFIVIGNGCLENALRNLCKELDICREVKFVGQQSDIVPFLSIIDIGINCSESEGLPNSILEFMAGRIPVVATNVGGNAELIDHNSNGFLVPKGNPGAIAEAVEKLIESRQLRTRMGNAGSRKVKENFSYQKILDMYQSYYLNLVGDASK